MSHQEKLKALIDLKKKEIKKIEKEYLLKEKAFKTEFSNNWELKSKKIQAQLKIADKELISTAKKLKKYKNKNDIPKVNELSPKIEVLKSRVKILSKELYSMNQESSKAIILKLKTISEDKTKKIKALRQEIDKIYKELMISKEESENYK